MAYHMAGNYQPHIILLLFILLFHPISSSNESDSSGGGLDRKVDGIKDDTLGINNQQVVSSPQSTSRTLINNSHSTSTPSVSHWQVDSEDGSEPPEYRMLKRGNTCDSAKLRRTVPTNCKSVYVQEANDTCGDIQRQFSLKRKDLDKMNPNYSCCKNQSFVPPMDQPLCVESYEETSKCLNKYVVKSDDTCWSIWVSHRLSEREFQSLNEGVNCSSLMPGQSVCVSNQEFAGQECILTMTVKSGETCQALAQRAGKTVEELRNLNERKLNCENLQSHQVICVSNDQRFKLYERRDQGQSKKMLQSAVRGILDRRLTSDECVKSRLQEYLNGHGRSDNVIPDLIDILSTKKGSKLLKDLEKTNKEFREFASFTNDHRMQICRSISDSPYKSCVCDMSAPFLNCQAKLFQMEEKMSRERRNVQNDFESVSQRLIRYRRATDDATDGSTHSTHSSNKNALSSNKNELKESYLQGFLDRLCNGCISTETGCLRDLKVCVPIPYITVVEICLGGGFCVPNPLSLINSQFHITVSQVEKSQVAVNLALCIGLINGLLSAFGFDSCVARGGVDYFYLKQQLHFNSGINLFLLRGSFEVRIQVARPFTRGVYDKDAQKVLGDMCTEEKYKCKDYCQVPVGDLYLEWKIEGCFFGCRNLINGTYNNPPTCTP